MDVNSRKIPGIGAHAVCLHSTITHRAAEEAINSCLGPLSVYKWAVL